MLSPFLFTFYQHLTYIYTRNDTEAFLGTQGYLWDTQTDMFLCLLGSILALLALTKLHNQYLLKMQPPQK